MEGGPGHVVAYSGVGLLDVPENVSRTGGDVHVFGNPHIHTDPINAVLVARNIARVLKRVDPNNAALYDENNQAFEDRVIRRLFGDRLHGGQPDANLERNFCRLIALCERPLHDDGALQRLGRRRERRHETVPGRLQLPPAVTAKALAGDAFVFSQQVAALGIAKPLDEGGRALAVCEEDGAEAGCFRRCDCLF